MDHVGMEEDADGTAGALLQADASRTQAARPRGQCLREVHRGHYARPAGGGMMSPREFWQRLKTWSQRDRLDAEVASELRVHVELLARDLEKDGLSRHEALASARRQIGNTTSQRESSRDAWGFP